MAQIVIIKHTEAYRGDHADPINESYIFNEDEPIKNIINKLRQVNRSLTDESGNYQRDKNENIMYADFYDEVAWFEIPVQKQSDGKVLK